MKFGKVTKTFTMTETEIAEKQVKINNLLETIQKYEKEISSAKTEMYSLLAQIKIQKYQSDVDCYICFNHPSKGQKAIYLKNGDMLRIEDMTKSELSLSELENDLFTEVPLIDIESKYGFCPAIYWDTNLIECFMINDYPGYEEVLCISTRDAEQFVEEVREEISSYLGSIRDPSNSTKRYYYFSNQRGGNDSENAA